MPQARGGRGGPSTSCTRRRRAARARAGVRTTPRRPTTVPPSRMAGAAASSALRPEPALPGRLYAVMPQNPCALCLVVCGYMSAGVSALLRVAYSRQAAHAENDLECRVMHRACAGRPAVRCRGGRQGNQRSAITTRCSTAGAAVAIHRGAAQRQRGGGGAGKTPGECLDAGARGNTTRHALQVRGLLPAPTGSTKSHLSAACLPLVASQNEELVPLQTSRGVAAAARTQPLGAGHSP